jgi:putative endonuclease
MPYMYILECSDGTYYTGSTWNLEKRLWEHQNGLGANHTKKRQPVKLLYFEKYSRVADAFKREKQVQGWTHAKKKALIEQNPVDLNNLSECRNETHCRNAAFDSAQAPGIRNAQAPGIRNAQAPVRAKDLKVVG